MKNILTIAILLGSLCTFSQTLSLDAGTTRAVVVGISDYQNEDIPDLRFADKDAEAFATYLKSSAGGNLPDENIKLLLNEKATMAGVAGELDWLVEESEEGDKAIIYFSGHGDVEAKTARQPGFLLTYDSPPKIYIAGAYPLFYLQLIIETLSSDKNVETLVITDACRAGKLAGSEIGGTQATAANLSKQYANEIKILSCQPDEFSLEGEQWGGGRGAFSYHLVEGLIGLADKNENQQVNLLELENYLETKVPEETAPQSQIPMTVGSKGTKISIVNSDILAELKSLKERELPTLAAIESRGIEQTLLAGLDTIIQQKYEAFIAALDDENLLDSEDGKPSADELYRELIQEESLADLHRFMTRQYATALQNDAQQVINSYLIANPTEMEKRWKGDTTYGRYPRYLGRAAELLGEQHYIYNYLIAKKLYFEGLNLRLKGDQVSGKGSFYPEALTKVQEAIELEDRAAYFYNELGVLNTRMVRSTQAKENFEKAIELAPEWGLPYVNYCSELFYSGEYEKAIEVGEKALEFLPQFPQMYNFLGWIHSNEYDWMSKQNYKRQGLELKDGISLDEANINSFSQIKIKYQRAIELLKRAELIDTTYMLTYKNLGIAYYQIREYQKADDALNKAIALDSLHWDSHYNLGRSFQYQRRYEDSEKPLRIALQLSTNKIDSCEILGAIAEVHRQRGEKEKFIEIQEKMRQLNPNFMYSYTHQAGAHMDWGEYKEAEKILLKGCSISKWPKIYAGLAYLYLNQFNRWEDAEFFALQGLEVKPDLQSSIEVLCNLYLKKKEYEKGLKWLEKWLEITPDNYRVNYLAGQMAYLNKEKAKAKIIFDKTVQIRESYLNRIGHFYRFHSEFTEAKSYLLKARKARPNIRQPYVNLGFIHYDQGLEEEGDKWLDSAWVKTRDPMVLDFKMYLALYKEDYENAQVLLDSLITYDSTYRALPSIVDALKEVNYQLADSLNNLVPDSLRRLRRYFNARVQVKLGAFEKAIQFLGEQGMFIPYRMVIRDTFFTPLHKMRLFQKELRIAFPEKFDDLEEYDDLELIQPETAPTYYLENCERLGRFYWGKKKHDRANFLFKKAIELKPDTLSNEAAMSLAIAYTVLGDYEKGKSICPDSIHSNIPDENLEYGRLYYIFKRPKSAETYFQKYVQGSEYVQRFRKVAWAYHDYGEEELAAKYQRKSLAIYPEDYYPYWDLGWLYFTCGNSEKAIQVMDEGIQRFPAEISLKGMQAMIIALSLSPSELDTSNVFKDFEKLIPDFSKVGTYLKLINQKDYVAAQELYKDIEKSFSQWWIPRFLILPEVRIMVAQKDFNGAMEVLKKRDSWIFNYPIMQNDPGLEALRATTEYQEFIKLYYPEKFE